MPTKFFGQVTPLPDRWIQLPRARRENFQPYDLRHMCTPNEIQGQGR